MFFIEEKKSKKNISKRLATMMTPGVGRWGDGVVIIGSWVNCHWNKSCPAILYSRITLLIILIPRRNDRFGIVWDTCSKGEQGSSIDILNSPPWNKIPIIPQSKYWAAVIAPRDMDVGQAQTTVVIMILIMTFLVKLSQEQVTIPPHNGTPFIWFIKENKVFKFTHSIQTPWAVNQYLLIIT